MATAMLSPGGSRSAPDHMTGPASWALQVLFLLLGLLALALGAPMLIIIFYVPQSHLLLIILLGLGILAIGAAHFGAFWGLNRGYEMGRTLATFVSGFYFLTVFLIPLGIGVMWILWHPHIPERTSHSLGKVLEALGTPHDRSGAAQTHPVDGLDTNSRRAICALLGLGVIVMVWFVFGTGTSEDNLPVYILLAVVHVLMLGITAVAVIGIGRGTEWGRPLATFVAGALVVTAYGLVPSLLIAFLLVRTRAQAAAPMAVATGTA